MDPEALVQCPYDKSHQVRASRLPYHIVKCQRNHPQVARMLATCPFNARHRVPQANLRSHIASCPDKRLSDLPHEMDMSLGNRMKQPEIPTAWQSPPCQEDWEAELEDLEDPPPFIFNIGMNDLLLPCDSRTSRGRGGPHGAPATPGSPENSEEATDSGRAVSCVLRTVPATALQHLPEFLLGGWIQPAMKYRVCVPPPAALGTPTEPPPLRAGAPSAARRPEALIGVSPSRRGLALAAPAWGRILPGAGSSGLVKAGN